VSRDLWEALWILWNLHLIAGTVAGIIVFRRLRNSRRWFGLAGTWICVVAFFLGLALGRDVASLQPITYREWVACGGL
jgi:hypothetical protein